MRLSEGETVAAELVRAVRGRRSHAAFSKRIGYRSNITRRWAAGECWPTASDFLTACWRVKPSLAGLYESFDRRAPAWLDPSDPFSPASVARFLSEQRGETPIGVLAERTGFNRYSVSRWLKGTAQPRLPELLCLIEATSRRVLDFIACITDPALLPSCKDEWSKLCAARSVAYDSPWSHAVLHALELEGYRDVSAARSSAWLARCLGISTAQVGESLEALARSGQIRKERGKWRADRVIAVDTSADVVRSRALKAAWTKVAAERLAGGAPGSFGYSVFAISRPDLQRLRSLQLQYVRAMQSLIADSKPGDCVGLYCAQLLDLSVET
jgi:hypothetical protein